MSSLLLSTLGVVCPSCDHHNPPKAAQCVGCRTPLIPLAQAPLPPAVPRVAATGVPPGMRPAPPVPPRQTSPGVLPPAAVAARFGLSVVSGAAKGQKFKIPGAGAQVGRSKGSILFAEDRFLSALHASFSLRGAQLVVRDEGSVSGVMVSVAALSLPPNTLFCAGTRLFRYSGAVGPGAPPSPGRPIPYGAPVPAGQPLYLIEEILMGGRVGRAFVSAGPLVTMGHTKCDVLLPNEEGIASRHCELSPAPTGAVLKDLSGGLGTFVRIPPGVDRPLNSGDLLRMGAHVVRVEALA